MGTHLGDLSVINVNDSILTIKDSDARQSIDDIVAAIELNNNDISQRINNLNTRLQTVEQIDLSTKQDVLVSSENIRTINGNSLLGSGNITLVIPTKVSDLPNDSGYQTQTQVETLISGELAKFDKLDYQIVQTLPATGTAGVRYLVKHATDDRYEEYIYINNQWFDIGLIDEINLTDYYTKQEADVLYDTKVEYTDLASNTNAGVVKTNTNKGISLNENGQLEVAGRLGKFSTTLGLYAPDDREPRNVYDYSLLMTDAKGVDMSANRSLAIVSGYGLTCQSAAAGTTQYKITNNYQNRIKAKCCENGYISLDEPTSKIQLIEPVLSVTINGKTFNPDSSADSSTPIIITVANSVNPTSSATSIRLFGKMQSYASAHIGNGVSSTGGGRSLLIGGGVTKTTGNDNCIVGMDMYSTGNGNAMFGRYHIARKNRSLLAGTGHDTTNARSESASALGDWSSIDSNTLFAIGNGTSATVRSNAFEVRNDGLVLKSPNGNRWLISVDNSGTLTTTAL